jgi:hypothetical protein
MKITNNSLQSTTHETKDSTTRLKSLESLKTKDWATRTLQKDLSFCITETNILYSYGSDKKIHKLLGKSSSSILIFNTTAKNTTPSEKFQDTSIFMSKFQDTSIFMSKDEQFIIAFWLLITSLYLFCMYLF